MKPKSFKDISLDITEEEYRNDGKMHYSTLSTFEREGFNGISKLKERKDTPSLTFGSAVDAILTGGMDEFNSKFFVADVPELSDTMNKIVKQLYASFGDTILSIKDINDDDIKFIADTFNYGTNWKPATVASKVREACEKTYEILSLCEDKYLITNEMYTDVVKAVNALREAPATMEYFNGNNPFDDSVEILYQLKFSANFEGIDYSCMSDVIKVDHNKKIVYPVDLKTSSDYEWDFAKAFIKWHYQIQARLYWRIIRKVMDNDPVFKDYTLAVYTFVVVNRQTLTPLAWKFNDTRTYGPLIYGAKKDIICPDPFDLAKELREYLIVEHQVPIGIHMTQPNDLSHYLEIL